MHIEHICSVCHEFPPAVPHTALVPIMFSKAFFCSVSIKLLWRSFFPSFLLGVDPLHINRFLHIWLCEWETLRTLLFQEARMIDCNSSTVMEGITRGMLEQTAAILFWTGSFPYKYLLYWKTDSYCSSDLEKILKNDWDFPCETNIKSCN